MRWNGSKTGRGRLPPPAAPECLPARPLDHCVSTGTFREALDGALVNSTISTPLSYRAVTFDGSTASGSGIARLKPPKWL